MGNCDCKVKDIEEEDPNKINLEDFVLLYPIGRGGFGRVWKVRFKRQYKVKNLEIRLLKNKSRIFAMKENFLKFLIIIYFVICIMHSKMQIHSIL